jgi:hypothetical protein
MNFSQQTRGGIRAFGLCAPWRNGLPRAPKVGRRSSATPISSPGGRAREKAKERPPRSWICAGRVVQGPVVEPAGTKSADWFQAALVGCGEIAAAKRLWMTAVRNSRTSWLRDLPEPAVDSVTRPFSASDQVRSFSPMPIAWPHSWAQSSDSRNAGSISRDTVPASGRVASGGVART